MVKLVSLHCTGKIRGWIAFGSTSNDRIAENLATALSDLFCLLCCSPAFHAAKHIQ
ncbi:Uncharacterised protein [Enterobacter cloacae]|nr:Uncharacterised protein [Enterobacter cloacae]